MTRAMVIGCLAWSAAARLRLSPLPVAASVGAVTAFSLAALPVVAVALARRRWRQAVSRAEQRRGDEESVTVFADLVSLGMTAGLSLRAAVEAAGEHLDGGVTDVVAALVAEMDGIGVGPALAAVEGPLAEFGRVAGGAAASGAPIAAAVSAFAATRRHQAHAERVAAARRLPVRLLLPLALLILPGFVVLAVGPALLQALARLGPTP